MKKTTKTAIYGTVSVLALSMALPTAVLAADSNNKCGGKNVAVANVESNLLVRAQADDSSEVIGYVPSAAGVIVKSMSSDWTKIQVGETTGYVKTGYLAFDDKAEELKSVYGVPGAVAAWDDVKIFADYEDTSSIIGTLNEGEGFDVLGSTDNWVEIQLASGDTAYVAAEDVNTTLVLEGPVALDEASDIPASAANGVHAADEAVYTETEAVYEEPVYTEAETAYEEPAYIETEAAYEEPAYTETEPVYEEPVYTETEAAYEEPVYTETEAAYTETEPVYTEDNADTIDDSFDDGITGDEYINPETESTASSSTANQDDLDLLAALIYCEAGNQSYEGKVAVGQVVMNRVDSGSFANTVKDVIYEGGQFTPASSGMLDSVKGNVPSECYDAAAAALNGEGTVGSALYFNTGSGKGEKIGDHQFY